MKTLLVTGTDTGVGKSWISCLLIRQLAAENIQVGGYKPVCSGSELLPGGHRHWNDVDQIQAACPVDWPADLICPLRFHAPLAPPLAATLQGEEVSNDRLVTGLERWRPLCTHLVIEGAGGLLSPVSRTWTVADMTLKFNAPLVIVAANRLGVVNHTLLTMTVARNMGLNVAAVVLNNLKPGPTAATEKLPLPGNEPTAESTNCTLLREWCSDVPLFCCDYRGSHLIPICEQARALQWSQTFAELPSEPRTRSDARS